MKRNWDTVSRYEVSTKEFYHKHNKNQKTNGGRLKAQIKVHNNGSANHRGDRQLLCRWGPQSDLVRTEAKTFFSMVTGEMEAAGTVVEHGRAEPSPREN
jgi:hypothetical protein